MKEKGLLILSLLIPFVMILIYVWSTAADVAFRDDMYLIHGGFVESYCKGNLVFEDIWRATAKTRILGYNLLQLINIKWFGMNSKIIALLIPFLMLGSALLIFREYRISLSPQRSPSFIAATFILLGLVIFNIVQLEGLTFAYGFVFQSPMPFFIASFISLELFLSKGKPQYWPAALILPVLAILVFGGSHTFSFAPALCAAFVCYVLTRRSSLPEGFWMRALFISVFLALLAFVYMYNIEHRDYFPNASLHADKVLERPLEALQFLFAAFGASVVGVNAANIYFSFHQMVLLGIFVLSLHAVSLHLFIKSGLYKRTYLPFFLLMQTFFYLMFMTLGRFGYGIDYGMSSRYTCVSVYGLVGAIWVIIFFLTGAEDSKPRWRLLLYVPIVAIFSGILLTSVVEWRIGPHRNAYFQNLKEIALRVDHATDDELSKFEERPELVRQSLQILKDCNLNVFHQSSVERQ